MKNNYRTIDFPIPKALHLCVFIYTCDEKLFRKYAQDLKMDQDSYEKIVIFIIKNELYTLLGPFILDNMEFEMKNTETAEGALYHSYRTVALEIERCRTLHDRILMFEQEGNGSEEGFSLNNESYLKILREYKTAWDNITRLLGYLLEGNELFTIKTQVKRIRNMVNRVCMEGENAEDHSMPSDK